METLIFALASLAVAGAGAIGVGRVVGRPQLAGAEAPRLQQMEKVAEALTKGVVLLTAVLGILASRDGGIGRLVANGGPHFLIATVCVVLSVVFAFAAWTVVAAAPERGVTRAWLGMTLVSIALFTTSIFGAIQANERADEMLERPSLSVEHTGEGLKFTATIDLLKADAVMRTEVHGYPALENSRRDLLFNSTSGPDASGQASLTGLVTADLSRYEVVEVRAFRGFDDPGCERSIVPEHQRRLTGDAACAAIWIEP